MEDQATNLNNGEEATAVNFNVYVFVAVDLLKGGNKNLECKDVFQFDLKTLLASDQDMGNPFLKFDLRRQGFVPTNIGEVLVPLKDLSVNSEDLSDM
ncbi:hypothetical protein COLO4_35226 [Corchorus olitorius]|uniref:Uncharacterized protein n=1 Tax=Corchorus olitorius TaxID=93759 RepID=A0A1R3GHT7_9ROSI|nr:hypothetical protein COLO4_35226 [Corchorus olitorius]